MTYLRKGYSRKETSQSQAIPGSSQVENSAGGFSWKVDDWKRLDRFLILGSEGGTYYIHQEKLTRENAEAVERCIKEDGARVVTRVVEISESGRASKNDPALFTLAMCASLGDNPTRKAALENLSRVARIGTHLFHFASYVEDFRGWGRGLRTAIGNWYNSKSPEDLGFQVTKYQQRDKWSNRDLLRLSHPKAPSPEHQQIYSWITKGKGETSSKIIEGFERAQATTNETELAYLIKEYGLTIEMVPTQFLTSSLIWSFLLPNLGYTALIRNLGNMSKSGLLVRGNFPTNEAITTRLTDPDAIKKSKVHPIGILTALLTYSQGHGIRGKGEWEVVPDIVDALDQAFYISFGNVTPTNKRLVLALDVSGSMSWGEIAGIEKLTPRLASAALAMVTYKIEKKVVLLGFQDKLVELDISRHSTLKGVEEAISNLSFGRTDCAQPMLWASESKTAIDTFSIYTDSETWFGKIHPSQALDKYRRETNIPSKLAVVGMVSNGFSIADPDDSGMLDVVGFDTATPEIISQFIEG